MSEFFKNLKVHVLLQWVQIQLFEKLTHANLMNSKLSEQNQIITY